jgi:hypothetical protein
MKTMKKTTFITLALVLISANLFAQAVSDTTFHYRDKTIQVKDSLDEVRVKVSKNGSIGYIPVYEGIFTHEKSVETYTVGMDFNINTPFGPLLGKDGEKPRMRTHWQGVGAGFSFLMNSDLAYRPFMSGEITLNALEISTTFLDRFGLVSGVGVVYRDYALPKNLELQQSNGVASFQEMGRDLYEINSLKQLELVFSLLFEWQPKLNLKHRLFLSGGILCSDIGDRAGMLVTKEKNGEYILKALNVRHNNIDVFGQIGYRDLGLYVKYSPNSIFQSQKGPNFSQLSVGLMVYF